MNINKSICMQLLSVMGCEIKGFKNEQTNVMELAIYKNNGKIGEFKDDGVDIKVNGRMLHLKYSCPITTCPLCSSIPREPDGTRLPLPMNSVIFAMTMPPQAGSAALTWQKSSPRVWNT